MLFEGYIFDLRRRLPSYRVEAEKKALRGLVEQRRRIYPKEKVDSESEQIVRKIEHMTCFREAKTVMLYYPIRNEVNVLGLMANHPDKTFLLPVTHRRHRMSAHVFGPDAKTQDGQYHIPEPSSPVYRGPIDLIIVPGVIFDPTLHRVGRGGGYYDHFLRHHRRSYKLGVGYDFQLQEHKLPHAWFDQKVNRFVSPTQTIG